MSGLIYMFCSLIVWIRIVHVATAMAGENVLAFEP